MKDMAIVFANDIPYAGNQLDPLEALEDTLAFSADDWSASRAMAWVYGIVCGWDDDIETPEEGDAMGELAGKFGWSADTVERLRELHRRFEALR
jgi:hypothetical protein